jgi:putative aminopeptidase FrvX
MAHAIPEPFRRLLEAIGPSGHEHGKSGHQQGPGQLFAEIAAEFTDDVITDVTGSTIATVKGTAADGPVVAVYGHVDEIGLIVTHIDDEGFIWFAPVGGWDPVNLMAQRVRIATDDGVISGVVGRKTKQMMTPEEQAKAPEITELHIDIGASGGEDARSAVSVGDVVVIDAMPMQLRGSRLAARAVDNRLGAYVALEIGRRLADSGGARATYKAIGNAQEEVTFAGARTATFSVEPDIAIVVDATQATDSPGMRDHIRETGINCLGSGTIIQRGPSMHPTVVRLLTQAGDAEGLNYTYEASGAETSTDADLIHLVRGGIATGVAAVPIRYMHSPVETVDLDDIENTIQLLVAAIKAVPEDLHTERGQTNGAAGAAAQNSESSNGAARHSAPETANHG